MKVPNNQKATKIKALNDKVETLGIAFTSYIQEVRNMKELLIEMRAIMTQMPGFEEALTSLAEKARADVENKETGFDPDIKAE